MRRKLEKLSNLLGSTLPTAGFHFYSSHRALCLHGYSSFGSWREHLSGNYWWGLIDAIRDYRPPRRLYMRSKQKLIWLLYMGIDWCNQELLISQKILYDFTSISPLERCWEQMEAESTGGQMKESWFRDSVTAVIRKQYLISAQLQRSHGLWRSRERKKQ